LTRQRPLAYRRRRSAHPEEPPRHVDRRARQRPGQLYVRASRSGDKVINVRVGGFAVLVMRGEYAL
jgi:predicted PhzF superfamily epimerase YddE/YHI9